MEEAAGLLQANTLTRARVACKPMARFSVFTESAKREATSTRSIQWRRIGEMNNHRQTRRPGSPRVARVSEYTTGARIIRIKKGNTGLHRNSAVFRRQMSYRIKSSTVKCSATLRNSTRGGCGCMCATRFECAQERVLQRSTRKTHRSK